MADLVWFVFSTRGVSLVLLAGALCWTARPGSKWARRLLLAAALFYVSISVYGVSYQLEQLLITGYRPLAAGDVPAGRTAVVVLGSGSFTARDWAGRALSIVDADAAERVLEATRIAVFVRPEWIISSGGSYDGSSTTVPPGETMRRALLELGLPEALVLADVTGRNTREEAVALSARLKGLGAEHIVLVTSSRHMRRAVGTFRSAGVEVIPAIARNSFLDRSGWEWWTPGNRGLVEAGLVVHEYLGIVAYRARGWYKP